MSNLLIWEVAPTKSEIEMYAQNICNELNEGFTKPEDLAVKMAAIETFAKTLRAKVEEHIIVILINYYFYRRSIKSVFPAAF